MEQERNGIVRRVRRGETASNLAFMVFAVFLVFIVLSSAYKSLGLLGLLFSLVLYLLSLKFVNPDLFSAAWIVLGISVVLTSVSSSTFVHLPVMVTFIVVALIASYEEGRFSLLIRSVIQKLSADQVDSLRKLGSLVRNHSIILGEVVTISFLCAVSISYVSSGLVIINPPLLSTTIFASVAILLIAIIVLAEGEH
jgi:hypothetical protein